MTHTLTHIQKKEREKVLHNILVLKKLIYALMLGWVYDSLMLCAWTTEKNPRENGRKH